MRLRFITIAAIALAGIVVAQDTLQGPAIRDEAAQNVLTPILAGWIRQSRDAAIERGVQSVPPEVREAFQGHIEQSVLERVRWRVDGLAALPGIVMFQPGAVRAITLDNVILFANEKEAANVRLWAHELYHVLQYDEWGVGGFAERFVSDHRAVEHDAREFRWSWMKATGRVPRVELL